MVWCGGVLRVFKHIVYYCPILKELEHMPHAHCMPFTIVVHFRAGQVLDVYFYDLTTLTYNELQHAQSKQHMAYLGVVNRRGQAKARFVAFVALV